MSKTSTALAFFAVFCLAGSNSVLGASASAYRKALDSSVAAGGKIRLGSVTDILKNCALNAMPDIKVIHAPAHGRLLASPFATGEYEKCNARKVPSLVYYYIADTSYAGSDNLIVRISYRSGHTVDHAFNITIVN